MVRAALVEAIRRRADRVAVATEECPLGHLLVPLLVAFCPALGQPVVVVQASVAKPERALRQIRARRRKPSEPEALMETSRTRKLAAINVCRRLEA